MGLMVPLVMLGWIPCALVLFAQQRLFAHDAQHSLVIDTPSLSPQFPVRQTIAPPAPNTRVS